MGDGIEVRCKDVSSEMDEGGEGYGHQGTPETCEPGGIPYGRHTQLVRIEDIQRRDGRFQLRPPGVQGKGEGIPQLRKVPYHNLSQKLRPMLRYADILQGPMQSEG